VIINLARRAHNHNWELDPITRSLLDTDFYKLLMLQFIWKNFPHTRVTSEVHNRTAHVKLGERISAHALRDRLERTGRYKVVMTRDTDVFIPLETRTAIANKAQADLFISVHANSSSDPSARGVETYYLNFTTSADALEVAARENAVSDQSIHQLSDLVKKITLQDKISESREFASDVQQSLYSGLEDGNAGLKDRGVKKAPFVVLIGANMPSILAEISFLTNPDDAHELHDPEYRERIAESLYRGVSRYVSSLSGVRIAQTNAHSSGN